MTRINRRYAAICANLAWQRRQAEKAKEREEHTWRLGAALAAAKILSPATGKPYGEPAYPVGKHEAEKKYEA